MFLNKEKYHTVQYIAVEYAHIDAQCEWYFGG